MSWQQERFGPATGKGRSRTTCGFAQTLHLHSRQKRDDFLAPGTTGVLACRDI